MNTGDFREVSEGIQQIFILGPSSSLKSSNFTSFLLSNGAAEESVSLDANKSSTEPQLSTLDLVLDACIQSVMIETDGKVIIDLLRAINTLHKNKVKSFQNKDNSIPVENHSAVVVLLRLFTLKPITLKTVLTELVLEINQEFLLDVMSTDFQSILDLTPVEGVSSATGEGGGGVRFID